MNQLTNAAPTLVKLGGLSILLNNVRGVNQDIVTLENGMKLKVTRAEGEALQQALAAVSSNLTKVARRTRSL